MINKTVFCFGGAGSGRAATEVIQLLCSPCHGFGAKGDGPAGQGLKKRPADLTSISIRHGGIFPEALITDTIEGIGMPTAHGTRDMPIWGDVFIGEAVGSSVTIGAAKKATSDVEQRIKRLVKYLESIQTAKQQLKPNAAP
jgi:hypothetical protein